jgi:TRAP transporter 4TM/12TM fusion protein
MDLNMTTDKSNPEPANVESVAGVVIADGVDDEAVESNRRILEGPILLLVTGFAIFYSVFHLYTLNIAPLETWTFRIVHVCGASILGFLLFSGARFSDHKISGNAARWSTWAGLVLLIPALFVLVQTAIMQNILAGGALRLSVEMETWRFGWPLIVVTFLGIILSWFHRRQQNIFSVPDLVLVVCTIAVASYLVSVFATPIRMTTGTSFSPIGITFAAVAGTALIFELTRRVAGLALVVISAVFLGYVFIGPHLPGFLGYPGLSIQRFFSQVYTDAGILGPTTAVSSTYIILFIIFAAFLQASKVGDYFVNFAFALAGRSRGGPAKVSIFASGLMGMINGTSAGNVVSTGSLTIPLMKKVGYSKTSAGAVEAAASTGGQIMPPIMGAGAFIMAEITGIPYTEIAIAAIIPAILYFASVYFMVDLEAARTGMRGMRDDELPSLRLMVGQIYLFIPIIILIGALFMGYSVIRAGTLATVSAAVVSWISPHKMGIKSILKAFELASNMAVQIVVVCACAGVIVAVISLTGVGARFSSLLLGVAEASQLLALFFAMCISIMLGMGMPTTAAYAVAASVVAPGLVQMGIPVLTAHFFVFYFAVVSAITPPVALASYAAAAISGAKAMETSIASFRIGLAAFIVPFMFFYNSALLMDADVFPIIRALITALVGVYLLSSAVQAWFLSYSAPWYLRILLITAAFMMIEGGLYTDIAGVAAGVIAYFVQKFINNRITPSPA